MKDFLVYLFWPNPVAVTYDNPKVIAALILCAVLIVGGFILSRLRHRWSDARLRKLSASWPSIGYTFGGTALLLVVSRVEQIQFLAMHFLWVVWLIAAIFVVWLQWKSYAMRYYEVLPRIDERDPRAKYLPHKRK